MKVNLDINNRDETIEFHYKHAKGSITISKVYVSRAGNSDDVTY